MMRAPKLRIGRSDKHSNAEAATTRQLGRSGKCPEIIRLRKYRVIQELPLDRARGEAGNDLAFREYIKDDRWQG